jgi:hypothetical protein
MTEGDIQRHFGSGKLVIGRVVRPRPEKQRGDGQQPDEDDSRGDWSP